MPQRNVPGRAEWSGYEQDPDAAYAFKLFFGKATHEIAQHFAHGQGIERASELQFMPRKAFQYYVFAFAEYLMSTGAAGDSDAASPFLHLLLERERLDPGSVSEVFADLAPIVEFVAANQAHFDADANIYGSFPELAAEIRKSVVAADTPNTSFERTRGR
jgi:hypothetical protein